MIRGKKKSIGVVLNRLGLLPAIQSIRRPRIFILNYHRIKSTRHQFLNEFDDGVFSPDCSTFSQQLTFLKKHIEFISLDDLIDVVRKGSKFNGDLGYVTFDDAYVDCYKYACPVLLDLKIPASFFIPTKIIMDRELGWWDLIAYFVKNTKQNSVQICGKNVDLTNDLSVAVKGLQQMVKTTKYINIGEFLGCLSDALGVPFPDAENQSNELLSWDQIGQIQSSGFDIGSHTHSHAILATLDSGSKYFEISESKKNLEAKLGREVRSIAYPVGNYCHFDEEVVRMAKDCGYLIGFSFNTGFEKMASNINPFTVKRSTCPLDLNELTFMLAFPPS